MAFFAIMTASAKSGVTIGDVELTPGATDVKIPIYLNNEDDFNLFSTWIIPSEGITVKKVSRGAIVKRMDADDEYYFVFDYDQASQNLIIYTMSDELLGSGEVVVLTVDVASDCTSGTIKLQGVEGSNATNKSYMLDEVKLEYAYSTGEENEGGSINDDEEVLSSIYTASSIVEVNQGQQNVIIPISLDNQEEFNLFSAWFTMPEGLTLASVTRGSIVKVRDNDDEYIFTFDYDRASQNVIIYTMSETSIMESGDVINLKVNVADDFTSGTILLHDVEGSNATNKSYMMPDLEISVNGIPTGLSSMDAAATASAIYNANGQPVSGKQRGLNIIRMTDGSVKKVMVK